MTNFWTEDKRIVERHKHLLWEVAKIDEDGVTPKKVEVFKIKRDGSRVLWFKLHYFNGQQTAGLYLNGDRLCSWCETCPLSVYLLNTTGYSATNCEADGVRCSTVFARYTTIFRTHRPSYRPSTRLCRNCSVMLNRDNKKEHCKRPECQKAYRDSRLPLVRQCKNCGVNLRRDCKKEYCRRPECRKVYQDSQFGVTPQCTNCGVKIRRDNETGLCQTNPECKNLHWRAWNKRKKQRELAEAQPKPLPA